MSVYSRAMRPPGRSAFVLLCWAASALAHADIYAFTDSSGVTHYSNVPSDSRFERVLRERVVDAARPIGTGWRARAATYAVLIDEAAQRAGVNPALLRAMIAVESAFDPRALSPKGAQGLMQLRPETARRYGVSRPFDPRENLRAGASYIRDLLEHYGQDVEHALAAYNAGEDAVDRHGRSIPPFPETRAYVPAVLRFYRRFLADIRSD
jgi:soluble lytic murein transglycosylase-like protein